MAETFAFDLVAPERNMASGAASMVTLPGSMGDIGVMPGHAPLVTTLRPGVVTAVLDGAEQKFVVFGGFAEIGPDRCAVLADEVTTIADLDAADVDARIEKAEAALAAADPELQLLRSQHLSDLQALKMYMPTA